MEKKEWDLLFSTLTSNLENPHLDETTTVFHSLVPQNQQENLDEIIGSNMLSYRDMILIQLAYAIVTPGLDTTNRPKGARGLGQSLGALFKGTHIPAIADAYQNLGKNSPSLVRGNLNASDEFLQWASTATFEELKACFNYACAKVASTARPVLPMPEILVAKLNFGAVADLFNELLSIPSEGAYEQFIIASLQYAFIEQSGPHDYRVETKQLNASDKSSNAAGDIHIAVGNRILEAYEITANNWRSKVVTVTQKLQEYDLSRIHIVAPLNEPYENVTQELLKEPIDISVIDLWGFIATTLANLQRAYREVALQRLYEYLDRYQESVERVNVYVRLLHDRHLTVCNTEENR